MMGMQEFFYGNIQEEWLFDDDSRPKEHTEYTEYSSDSSEDQTEQQENTESTEYTEEDVEETDNSEHAEEDVEETDNSEDPAQDEAEGEVDHADDSSEEDEDEDEKESEVKLRVPMCCAVCESDVREVLEQLKGVNSVTCNYKKHKVKVTGTADHLQVLQACRRINGASYFWQDS